MNATLSPEAVEEAVLVARAAQAREEDRLRLAAEARKDDRIAADAEMPAWRQLRATLWAVDNFDGYNGLAWESDGDWLWQVAKRTGTDRMTIFLTGCEATAEDAMKYAGSNIRADREKTRDHYLPPAVVDLCKPDSEPEAQAVEYSPDDISSPGIRIGGHARRLPSSYWAACDEVHPDAVLVTWDNALTIRGWRPARRPEGGVEAWS